MIKQQPPALWLEPCTRYLPERIEINATGDLARAIPPLVSAIEQCNEDKRRLREWAVSE